MKLNKIIVILGFYGSQLKEYLSLVRNFVDTLLRACLRAYLLPSFRNLFCSRNLVRNYRLTDRLTVSDNMYPSRAPYRAKKYLSTS